MRSLPCTFAASLFFAVTLAALCPDRAAADVGNVYVSRFWHNHQPTYWPEWNNNGDQKSRVQYAWDSIVLKPYQTYGGITSQHPENNLSDIFGWGDRVASYQSGPRNSLAGFNSAGGFAISYSGSLIDNVRQLGSVNQLGYGSGWNNGYKEARGWKTPSGSTRMDLVGFTYHHSLAPLLPKSVFRKELQIFKQAWWKAWGGKSDLSDHSKGYFPTEMAFSEHMIDVLSDEGYQWAIVASHHLSRTCPTYMGDATYTSPETGAWKIYSSPPNKADQLGPSPASGWWYGEPNPGNAARNVAPYAYQLHKVKYVNPDTGAEKTMFVVPTDDVLSYRYGYANVGIDDIINNIEGSATDPLRPVIVMPATDGDNAWGGGSSSWFEATPQFFNNSASRGYKPSTPQDFVNAAGWNADLVHIEDGAWIFPEMDYGSPNFLKWIEPPVATVANRGVTTVPGTQIDMETPGFALKFYSYAPLMAGANWCETAEQIMKDEGGSVQAWKIQAPYDWDGSWTSPNEVEQAWHIYLTGLDSGFNYYGGLGNDDEIKPSLATRRAVEKLEPWINANGRRDKDKTGPTVLKPQRFPYNPGGYTFGWFNNVPGVNTAFLKRMNSDFYIWTHAYDINGISNIVAKVRFDNDGTNSLSGNQNETYAGGNEVGQWQTIPMTKKPLPKTREALNAAAANGQIDYFLPVQDYAVADYYFAHITDTNLPNFRNKLLDYYVEATDSKGNTNKSEIQHVWVDDYSGQTNGGGSNGGTNSAVTLSPTNAVAGQSLTVTYNPAGRVLSGAASVNIHYGYNGVQTNWTAVPGVAMTKTNVTNWTYTYTVPANATSIAMCFNNGSGTWDNNGGGNWNFTVTTNPITNPPAVPTGLAVQSVTTNSVSLKWTASPTANSYVIYRGVASNFTTVDTSFVDAACQPDTDYSYAVAAVNVAGSSERSASVAARTLFMPVGINSINIVTPSISATNTNSSGLFSGHAGLGLTNGLIWSNSANGQIGLIAYAGATNSSGWSWYTNIALATGENTITFSAFYPTNLPPQQTGSDAPTNYSANWMDGTSGGTGFGAWSITNGGTGNAASFLAEAVRLVGSDQASNYNGAWTNGSGGGNGFGNWSFANAGDAGFFVGDPTTAGIGGMGGTAFQLRCRGLSGNNFAAADLPLNQVLSAGQVLSFLWGINWDSYANGVKGFELFSGTDKIVAVNNGSNSIITFNGVDTGFGYGTNAMRWSFKMVATNALEVSANDRDGSGVFRTNLTVLGAPSSLHFYAANMETNTLREPYFDDFRIENVLGNMDAGNPDKGFGLWAYNGGSITARRALPSAMKVGDSVSVRLDNNWIDTGGKVGISMGTADGTSRLRFYFVGGQFAYSIDDAVSNRNTQIGYTSGSLMLTFTLTGSNAYSLSTGSSVVTGTLAGSGEITQFAAYNENAGAGTDYNCYVGEMTFTEQRATNALVSVIAPVLTVQSASGIPDSWWDQFSIPTNERIDAEDRDHDGFSNAQEHSLGTDPTNSMSRFEITRVTRGGDNTVVEWSSVAGKKYRLYASPSLTSANWQAVGSGVKTAAGTKESDTNTVSTNSYFYRVQLVP